MFSFTDRRSPEITLGEITMSNKILVAYASRAGSTAGVAEAIGKTLTESGVQVEVRPMASVSLRVSI